METYNGIEFDSKEEVYIYWYIEELKERGYIVSYEREICYSLFDGNKELKLREHNYKPDFIIKWSDDGSKYFPSLGNIWEVKGTFDYQNMTRLFKINQKWMYAKYGLYVTKIEPKKLFKETFVPKRYLLTDTGKGERKISEKYLNLDEYIQSRINGTGVQKSRKRKLQ